jgi:hypothetical protein
VCYPKEAVVYSKEALAEAERLGYIAYNFVTGGNNTCSVIVVYF